MLVVEDKPKAAAIMNRIKSGRDGLIIPRIALGELFYLLLRKNKERLYDEMTKELQQFPNIRVVDLSDAVIKLAGKAKHSTGSPFIDCIIYATASATDSDELLSRDPDLKAIERKFKSKPRVRLFPL